MPSAISCCLSWCRAHVRLCLVGMALWSLGLLAFGLYLQHVVGLVPCPMCVVQRYTLVGVALLLLGLALSTRQSVQRGGALVVAALAVFGAFTAARQSWLQWFPPEVYSCGRDFYGMIERFPLSRAIPMIFRGSGDCTAIDWTFLGLSIANWSFLNFSALTVLLLGLFVCTRPQNPDGVR